MHLDLENCPEEDLDSSILHEFGHALGFFHEHQRPDGMCNREFRWGDGIEGYQRTTNSMGMFTGEDCEGRRPGDFYTWSSGPPNNITYGLGRQKHTEQSRKFTPRLYYIPKDRCSIMHYHFQSSLPRGVIESEMLLSIADLELTQLDIRGMAEACPLKTKSIKKFHSH